MASERVNSAHIGVFGDNGFMLLSLEVKGPGVEQSSPVDSMTFKATKKIKRSASCKQRIVGPHLPRSAISEWCDVQEHSEEKRGVSQNEGNRLATDIGMCPRVSSCGSGCRCVGDGELDSFSDNEIHH